TPDRVKVVAWIVASELAEQTAKNSAPNPGVLLVAAEYQYLGTSPVVVREKEPVSSSGPVIEMGPSVSTPPESARSPCGHWTESLVTAGTDGKKWSTRWASSPAAASALGAVIRAIAAITAVVAAVLTFPISPLLLPLREAQVSPGRG